MEDLFNSFVEIKLKVKYDLHPYKILATFVFEFL